MKIKKLLPVLCFLFLLTNIITAQEEIFVVVEDMPMFPGCEEVEMAWKAQ